MANQNMPEWAVRVLAASMKSIERQWISSDGKIHALSSFGQIYLVTPDGLVPEALEIGEWVEERPPEPYPDATVTVEEHIEREREREEARERGRRTEGREGHAPS